MAKSSKPNRSRVKIIRPLRDDEVIPAALVVGFIADCITVSVATSHYEHRNREWYDLNPGLDSHSPDEIAIEISGKLVILKVIEVKDAT